MKKFDFRLQPILELRRRQEDQKKRAVGSLLADIARQQQQALEMAQEVRQQGRILKKQFAGGTVDVGWISYYQSYVGTMYRSIAQRIENVSSIQKSLAIARKELSEAAKQTKILEKLREKQKLRYDDRLRRAETNLIDELGMNAYCRSLGSP